MIGRQARTRIRGQDFVHCGDLPEQNWPSNSPVDQQATGFTSEAISDWARRHLAHGNRVISDGLACFRAVPTGNHHHNAVVTGGQASQRPAEVLLDQHSLGQPQDQLLWDLSQLQFFISALGAT